MINVLKGCLFILFTLGFLSGCNAEEETQEPSNPEQTEDIEETDNTSEDKGKTNEEG